MSYELIFYHKNVTKTYLHFIKQNLSLIKELTEEKRQPGLGEILKQRALHLQVMSLIGLTAEHLIKLILLKRGFVLNESCLQKKFSTDFINKLAAYNEAETSQDDLDYLHKEAVKSIQIKFDKKLVRFEKCKTPFLDSNGSNYFSGVGTFRISLPEEGEDYRDYFGETELKPENILNVIQKMRNSYLHRAEALYEKRGIIDYMINFLVWLCKKEYPDFFEGEKYFGNADVIALFESEHSTSG